MEVLRFAREFRLEIFFLYREINNLVIIFWAKDTLVSIYSRAVIT